MIIYLIGMMGSGKTTVGNLLAIKLGLFYIDMDVFIEKKCQLSVSEIVENFGIDHFRKMENELLVSLQKSYDIVVATGGGVVLNQNNIDIMKKSGTVIYLKTSINILKRRLNLSERMRRPLLKELSLDEIYEFRKELYEKASDIIINCDNLTVNEICEEIICQLNYQD